MYKYQEETFHQISQAIDKLEEMTEEHYRVQIGFRHTNNIDEANIPIFMEINNDYKFSQQRLLDIQMDCYTKCDIYSKDRIELFDDIFLKIVQIIDTIIQDNKKREKFYKKLELQLKALNTTL